MAKTVCRFVSLPFATALLLAGALAGRSAVALGQAEKPEPSAGRGVAHLRPPRLPAIVPPHLAEQKTTLKLPAAAHASAVGGGGRYLIFHLKEVRKLAIFDANLAKIVHFVPLASDDIAFAAGADKLIIVQRDKRLIHRWSLETFERELTRPVMSEHPLATVALGSGSNGPIFIGQGDFYNNGRLFLDLDTLEPAAIDCAQDRWRGSGGKDCVVRASANGRVLTVWRLGTSPSGLQDVVIGDTAAVVRYEHDSVGDILPSPDGRLLYTGAGIFTRELKPYSKTEPLRGGIPAVHGDLYLRPLPEDRNGDVAVHIAGDTRPVVTIPGVLPMPPQPPANDRTPEAIGMLQYYLIPGAQMLVTLPWSNDRLEVHRFNLDEAMAKSGVDFLLIMSQPPMTAERGAVYSYAIDVKSKRGGVKYQLASAPAGMRVTADGTITWPVPGDEAASQASVIIAVSDATGQEVFQNFSIGISGAVKPGATPDPPSAPAAVASTDGAAGPRPEWDAGIVPRIDPVAIAADRLAVRFPDTYSKVVVAGGGRYLVFLLPRLRQLAVFDVSLARIVKYVPLGSDDVAIAGGGDRLIVAARDKRVLQRYNLRTFERELTVAAPTSGTINAMGMGSSTTGPVVLYVNGSHPGDARLLLLDGTTLQPTSLPNAMEGFVQRLLAASGFMRVSSDGRLVLLGSEALAVSGNKITRKGNGDNALTEALPNADGSVIYSPQRLFNGDLKPIGTLRPPGVPIPAVQPGFYLIPPAFDHGGGQATENQPLTIHLEGDARPLVSLDLAARAGGGDNRAASEGIGTARRFYFVPDANALVQLVDTDDQLLVYKVDIEAMLRKSEVDYLYVASRPPPEARLGKQYQYQLVVKSKRGGVSYELTSAPAGMTLSPAGLLTWTVPADFAEDRQDVIVLIKDSTGQETYHTFSIALPEKADREHRRLVEARAQQAAEEEGRRLQQMEVARVAEQNRIRMLLQQAEIACQRADQRFASGLKASAPPPAAAPAPRIWTDTDGNQLEASLAEVFAGVVSLRKESGQVLAVPVERLGAADRKLVEEATAAAVARRESGTAETAVVTAQSHGRLRHIATGLLNVATATKQFPAAYTVGGGKETPLLSWRVHLLPYIGYEDLYRAFRLDQPWDSEHNKQLIRHMPLVYRAPGSAAEAGKTNYIAVRGAHCVFRGPAATRLADVVDGVAKTATVVEANDEAAVVWTSPDDFQMTDGASLLKLAGLRSKGFNTVLVSGDVLFVGADTAPEMVERLFRCDDGQPWELK